MTVPRGKILDEALKAELIPALKQAQTPHNADIVKHCQYHCNYGHMTEGCQALKDKIEELVQASHIRKFIRSLLPHHGHPNMTLTTLKTKNALDE